MQKRAYHVCDKAKKHVYLDVFFLCGKEGLGCEKKEGFCLIFSKNKKNFHVYV